MELIVAGIGPGDEDGMTLAVRKALARADLIVGYDLYIDLVRQYFPSASFYSTPMRGERERAAYAVREAAAGKSTVLICSGDAGIYGMASLALEEAERIEPGRRPEIRVLPGVTAAVSAAALAGSPLTCDFAVISLSDLMVPWSMIEQRLEAAAKGGFVIALYNPGSKKRRDHLAEACRIISRYRGGDTVCAVVENIGRPAEKCSLMTLDQLTGAAVGMTATVLIGNSYTVETNGRMVTPRGYGDEYGRKSLPTDSADGAGRNIRGNILLFGGTKEGRELAETALEEGFRVTVSVATEYGAGLLRPSSEGAAGPELSILQGRMPREEILERLRTGIYDWVIDATHPYAEHITESIRGAAEAAGVAYDRVLRFAGRDGGICDTDSARAAGPAGVIPAADADTVPAAASAVRDREDGRILFFRDMGQIIRYLNEREGRVFFSTGSAAARQYAALTDAGERAVIRILPSEKAIAACRAAGFDGRNLICMQGPFDQAMNEACFRYADADYLVTKYSGGPGGYDAKVRAALALGMTVLVLSPPAQTAGISLSEMKEKLRKWKKQ